MMDVGSLLTAQGAQPKGAQPKGAAAAALSGLSERQAEETGKEFEAMFLAQMMAPMFEGLGEDSLFGGRTAKAYRSVMLQEYGKAITAGGGIGIADQVKAEILKLQEVAR